MATKRPRHSESADVSHKRIKQSQKPALPKEDSISSPVFAYETDWSDSDLEDREPIQGPVAYERSGWNERSPMQRILRLELPSSQHEIQEEEHMDLGSQSFVDVFGATGQQKHSSRLSKVESDFTPCLNLELPRYMLHGDEKDIFDLESPPESATGFHGHQLPFPRFSSPGAHNLAGPHRVQLTQREFGLLEDNVFMTMLRSGQEIYMDPEAIKTSGHFDKPTHPGNRNKHNEGRSETGRVESSRDEDTTGVQSSTDERSDRSDQSYNETKADHRRKKFKKAREYNDARKGQEELPRKVLRVSTMKGTARSLAFETRRLRRME